MDDSYIHGVTGYHHLTIINPKERRQGFSITKEITVAPFAQDPMLCPVRAYNNLLRAHPIPINLANLALTVSSDSIRRHIHHFHDLIPRPAHVKRPKARALGSTLAAIRTAAKQFGKWLRTIRAHQTRVDRDFRINDVYCLVLKLHTYHPFLFDMDMKLSEQDYVIKFWAPVIGSLFINTAINPLWGDTIPGLVMDFGIPMKVDLRLLDKEHVEPDFGMAEFAQEVFSHKMYKDKAKMVVAAKTYLNYFLSSNTFEVFTLRLANDGLYLLELVASCLFPTTLQQILSGKIKELVQTLDAFVDLCVGMNSLQHKNNEKQRLARRKSMTDLTNTTPSISAVPITTTSSTTSTVAADWTRPVWCAK
ncbi:hypothetical protein DM01DRAFT_321208 [Hesseltinella vesiculosa]|uniref:Uncharacterized protein n=1 Tax=Hesseltinella vesiculosa TaxID=101127 RepID=A0A1X2GY77_9FUNG|nr:hypothetical protein DM01DRAFT_321208 [Hesseltinella vesiculosa]